jgi:hypothetical protein
MQKKTFELWDFWTRCNVPVYDARTGEYITIERAQKDGHLEVTEFAPRLEGETSIEVWLEVDE